jgi:hypothetical protein
MAFEPKPQPTILPVIASDHYDAFRGILRSHIPDTYDEWLNPFTKWEQEWRSYGSSIRRVDVNPRDFSRHLDTTGQMPAWAWAAIGRPTSGFGAYAPR